MRIFMLSLAAVVAVAGLATVDATASETGMAGIHSWKKVGRKTCMIDHQHSGSGSGATRKAAEMQAISSWASFTELEYGSSWASYSNAIEKSMSCSGSSGSISCELNATPCRPW